jgi:hypothetical protein
MRHSVKLFTAALLGLAALSTSARAELVIDITQQGSNVVASASGSLFTEDLITGYGGSNNWSFNHHQSGGIRE